MSSPPDPSYLRRKATDLRARAAELSPSGHREIILEVEHVAAELEALAAEIEQRVGGAVHG